MEYKKTDWGGWLLKGTLISLLLMSLFYFWQMRKIDLQNRGNLLRVSIVGEYSVDGQPWQPLEPDTDFGFMDLHTITIRGHFSDEIPQGQTLFFRLNYMWVRLKVDGRQLFSSGVEGGPQPGGNVWAQYLSPGIAPHQAVELTFGNQYYNGYRGMYREFLRQLYVGTSHDLLFRMLQERIYNLLPGLGCILAGLLLFSLCIVFRKHKGQQNRRMFWLGALVLTVGVAFCMDFSVITLLFPYPAMMSAIYMECIYLMPMLLMWYISLYLEGWLKRTCHGAQIAMMLLAFILTLVELGGGPDLYATMELGAVICVVCFVIVGGGIVYQGMWKKERETQKILLETLPFIVGGSIEMINVPFQLLPSLLWYKSGFLIFTAIQVVALIRVLRKNLEQVSKAQQMENELTQSRISMMLSQIKPHFIFNVLNSISQLCAIDPPRAEQAVVEFAGFLRGNLDSLGSNVPIPFQKELAHVKSYLSLESMRFGRRIHTVFDIRVTGFQLPPLTLQPVVENAIRHGLLCREEGGTVLISANETEKQFIVIVRDDGVGFTPGMLPQDGKVHVGLQNVQYRVEAQCGGVLQVESRLGEGTTVTISLPKSNQN